MQDQKILGMKPRRKLSFAGRIFEALRVGFCMLAICAICILGVSFPVWAILVALDPRHRAFEVISAVARFDQIPLGVALGLSAFFSAVTWDTARVRLDSYKTLADRQPERVRQNQKLHGRREVS